MQRLSSLAGVLFLGPKTEAATQLRSVTVTNSTTINWAPGADLALGDGTALSGQLAATKVWNAVWNDIVDFQTLCDELVHGKCYFDTFDGAKICTVRNQKSVIGIASDTFGFAVGRDVNKNQVPIAIGGWVLAFVDKVYESGTVLTNDKDGNLTEMTRDEKMEYPERIVALYKSPEYNEYFGDTNNKVKVNGRHWVKVK